MKFSRTDSNIKMGMSHSAEHDT